MFRPEAAKEYTTNKQATKTMGRATVNTHDPNEFLRRTRRDELATCEEKTFKDWEIHFLVFSIFQRTITNGLTNG